MGLFLISTSLGCATYQSKVDKARNFLKGGEYQSAIQELEPLAQTQDGDQLVYLLDYAVALQIAGRIDESNKVFLQADRLSEQIDYHSISRVAGSLAVSEEMVQYKGDTFEKIFINAYLAMNFLEQNKLDDALVEARRINQKYLKYRADDKKKHELNVFSKYLSAMIWEADRSYDDAYIAFAEAYKIDPSIPTLPEDLIRTSKLSRRSDAYSSWKKKFPNIKENSEWYDKNLGELVVIFQQGWGPRKIISSGSYRLPTLQPVHNETQKARANVMDKSYFSVPIYDVQQAAIKTLEDDYAMLAAKRVAGVATKEVLADQVRQKDELLGALTWIALHASDRADLRQWSTLPQSIQTLRVNLKPGKYKIHLQGLNFSGNPTGENDEREVEIKAGQKKFVVWRSLK